MVLVFVSVHSGIFAFIILRVVAVVRRMLRTLVLFILVIPLNFLVSQILFHQLVNHRVVILHWDQVFSSIFDTLHFNFFNHLFLENGSRFLSLENDVFVVSAFLFDDHA